MITPQEILEVASHLMNNEAGDEAKLRTSIGRSYYAAYHYARNFYSGFGKNKHKPEDESIVGHHAVFIDTLKKHQDRKLQGLGNRLFTLKKDREDADYKLKKDISKASAQSSYKKATKIKSFLDE